MNQKYQDLRRAITTELHRRQTHQDRYHWQKNCRPQQFFPSGDWKIWLIMAGRGFGKTRTGAESIRWWASRGIFKRICLLAHTLEEARQVMVEGDSGILSVSPLEEGVTYFPSKRQILWPNGSQAFLFSADSPHQLRGPQFDAAWVDELAKMDHLEEVWDQLNFCLRLGSSPKMILTTTPRSIPFLKKLMQHPEIVITRGTTYDNAQNLSPEFLKTLQYHYENTTVGQQEIYGQFLEKVSGALWTPKLITHASPVLPLQRVIVSIDPSVTHGRHSDETGIVVTALDAHGRGCVLEDVSGQYSPTEWIHRAVEVFQRYNGDRIIAEVNNGGDLVEHLLRTFYPHISYHPVRASRGKIARAEPICALYEQGKVYHGRPLPLLEKQMLSYTPDSGSSPDRLDALVWGLHWLFFSDRPDSFKVWSI